VKSCHHCSICNQWSRRWRKIAVASGLTFLIWMISILAILLARRADVISEDARQWLIFGAVTAGMCVWLVCSVEFRPSPIWTSVGTSDWISIVYFPPLTFVGWWQVFATSYGGLKLLWIVAGFTAFFCFFAYEVALRVPARVDRFSRRIIADRLTVEMLSEEYDLRVHRLRRKKRSEKWMAKYKKNARRGAEVRREMRKRGSGPEKTTKAVIRLVVAYANTPSWLSAFFTSASLFAALFTLFSPSLPVALVLFSPIVTIGPIDIIRELVQRRAAQKA